MLCLSRATFRETWAVPVTKSSYSGAGCYHQPITYRPRIFWSYEKLLFQVFPARELPLRIVGQPACTRRTIAYHIRTQPDKLIHNPVRHWLWNTLRLNLNLTEVGRLKPNLWASEQRTVSTFRRLQSTVTGGWHGRHPVQVSSQCSHSYILLDLGRLDVGKFLAWT